MSHISALKHVFLPVICVLLNPRITCFAAMLFQNELEDCERHACKIQQPVFFLFALHLRLFMFNPHITWLILIGVGVKFSTSSLFNCSYVISIALLSDNSELSRQVSMFKNKSHCPYHLSPFTLPFQPWYYANQLIFECIFGILFCRIIESTPLAMLEHRTRTCFDFIRAQHLDMALRWYTACTLSIFSSIYWQYFINNIL